MEDVRKQIGDGPVYISFDIDALDPAYAPGTGLVFLHISVIQTKHIWLDMIGWK